VFSDRQVSHDADAGDDDYDREDVLEPDEQRWIRFQTVAP
jgi:hypothetical protein